MRRPTKILVAILVIVGCLVQLIPFYLAFTTAFKQQSDLSSVWSFPFGAVTWDNFVAAVVSGGVLRATFNSAVVTVIATVLTCVLAALAAYPLARRRTRLNRSVEFTILAVMMVPPLSILVPLYSLLNTLGLLNSYAGLILPLACLELPRAIFLYTQFLRAVPISLEEAARVDGASRLQTLRIIIFPLLKPVTVTVIILTAVYVWNEFALSSYIMTSTDMRTLAPSIAAFFGANGSNTSTRRSRRR
ncbi:carbohydrate ABC transporter permease [Microbacterium paulum]|uniref:carbohydrate ABC transporter permease n=1 Tax=Microbacterium paulum TaxID=2707006 RepID=UPI0019D684E7|nr:carbohydrate ABC transporter permease [Microbacterium paulum]